jgi:hypothetical protein
MFSNIGPNAPLVPCPPIRGILPAVNPVILSKPKALATPIEMKFWQRMMTNVNATNTARVFPPCFMTFRLQVKPTEVKKNTIIACLSVSS